MRSKLIFIVFLVGLLGCQTITEEEAIIITQDFVNQEVKFYVNEEDNATVVNRASIEIQLVKKVDNNYQIYLAIKSNQTGEEKKSNLIVVVDGKEGVVIPELVRKY